MARQRDDQNQAEARPDFGRNQVGLELEIAKQNQELAKFRYLNDVRVGRAWEHEKKDRRPPHK
jgi:hypothetical protein